MHVDIFGIFSQKLLSTCTCYSRQHARRAGNNYYIQQHTIDWHSANTLLFFVRGSVAVVCNACTPPAADSVVHQLAVSYKHPSSPARLMHLHVSFHIQLLSLLLLIFANVYVCAVIRKLALQA